VTTKIPFAYSSDLKRVVEVASVPSGKACRCICPSCGQAVQARKGKKNNWCFSHDPTPDDVPGIECKISFLVSARQFITDAALAGDLPDFTTTRAFSETTERLEIQGTDKNDWPSIQVKLKLTEQNIFQNLRWEKGPGHYDLSMVFPERKLHLYLSYPGKDRPELPEKKGRDGYMELDIKSIESGYIDSGSVGLNILTMAKKLFTGTEFKRWIYHPRETENSFQKEWLAVREIARKQLSDEYQLTIKNRNQRKVYCRNDSTDIRHSHRLDITKQEDGPLTPEELAASRRWPDLFKYHINNGYSQKSAAKATLRIESRHKPKKN